MDNAQAQAEKIVHTMLSKDTFSVWLGVKLLEIKPDTATVSMTVRREMLNGFGVCHGGIPFSLADSALAFASNTAGHVTVSIENSISYPAKVLEGDVLTAKAELLTRSNRIAHFDVQVHNQEQVKVALFRGTVYRTDKRYLD